MCYVMLSPVELRAGTVSMSDEFENSWGDLTCCMRTDTVNFTCCERFEFNPEFQAFKNKFTQNYHETSIEKIVNHSKKQHQMQQIGAVKCKRELEKTTPRKSGGKLPAGLPPGPKMSNAPKLAPTV